MSALNERIKEKLQERSKNRVLNKTLMDLPQIDTLLNVKKAAQLAVKLLNEGKKGLVVGDYDADGIMSTTIVIGYLRDAGYTKENIDYIIPSRLKDGYGLSQNIIDFALEQEFDFIITVDNGIAAVDPIKNAKDAGLVVIVTDHHTAPAVLPPADVIVNPKQPGETFPFIDISGATVAWYFVAALREAMNAPIDIRKYLDFVAITVVSDVMPLNDINLALLKYGLDRIKKQERYIYKLLWNEWTIPTLTETDLSFSLVPMINAIGRIDDANIGVDMFLSRNTLYIEELFHYIKDVNEKRKILTREFLHQSENIMDLEFDVSQKAIVVKSESFHEGIVGIIAGKLAENYRRPAFVFTYSEEKGVWKGSGRSAGEVHLYDLTNKAKEYILGFGGHKGAVGAAVLPEEWDNFKNAIESAALEIPDEDFIDRSNEEMFCDLEEFTEDTLNTLDLFAPYGEGNPAPVFEATGKVVIEREMKNGIHYKCKIITKNGKEFTGLFFNVKKDEFKKQIGPDTTFTFMPTRTYNPRTNVFGFELICTIKKD